MKKIILTGVTGLILGCTPLANRELAPAINFGMPREETYHANFFVGKEWYDRNKNNSLDKEDGYYNPEVFHGKELITIIADINGYEGTLTTRIWNGKTGHIVRTTSKEIYGKTLVQYSFTAEDIRNNPFGGEGKYRVAWYLGNNDFENEKIKSLEFEIRK